MICKFANYWYFRPFWVTAVWSFGSHVRPQLSRLGLKLAKNKWLEKVHLKKTIQIAAPITTVTAEIKADYLIWIRSRLSRRYIYEHHLKKNSLQGFCVHKEKCQMGAQVFVMVETSASFDVMITYKGMSFLGNIIASDESEYQHTPETKVSP